MIWDKRSTLVSVCYKTNYYLSGGPASLYEFLTCESPISPSCTLKISSRNKWAGHVHVPASPHSFFFTCLSIFLCRILWLLAIYIPMWEGNNVVNVHIAYSPPTRARYLLIEQSPPTFLPSFDTLHSSSPFLMDRQILLFMLICWLGGDKCKATTPRRALGYQLLHLCMELLNFMNLNRKNVKCNLEWHGIAMLFNLFISSKNNQ